jgi:hypothetical protein
MSSSVSSRISTGLSCASSWLRRWGTGAELSSGHQAASPRWQGLAPAKREQWTRSCSRVRLIAPVLREVSVADDRSELEDGFGAVQAPAGAGDVHAVLDEMATGALDHAGSNRPAAFERGGVVQERLLAGQVGGALVDARASA